MSVKKRCRCLAIITTAMKIQYKGVINISKRDEELTIGPLLLHTLLVMATLFSF